MPKIVRKLNIDLGFLITFDLLGSGQRKEAQGNARQSKAAQGSARQRKAAQGSARQHKNALGSLEPWEPLHPLGLLNAR